MVSRVLAAIVCLLVATPAWAQDAKTSSLSWLRLDGAETCVSTQDLARDVETRLHRPVFVSPARADVSVEGHIEPASSGWHAHIVLRDGAGASLGTRDLRRDDASCDAMREPLALIVAVMIDPDAALSDPPAPVVPAPAPPAPAPPAPTPPAPDPVREAPAPRKPAAPSTRFDGGASFDVGVGVLPHVAPGVQVDGLLQLGKAPPLEGRGAVFPGETVPVANGGGNEKSFAFAYVAGGLCPLWHHGSRLHAYGCAAAYVGGTRVVDTGPARARATATYLFLAPALEGRLSLRVVGPFSVRVGVAGLVPLLRPGYVGPSVTGANVAVYRAAPVAAMLDVGLGLVLP